MLDTGFLRSQVDQTRDIGMEFAADLAEDYIRPLCDELDAVRADLAEAGRIIRLAVAKCGKSCIPCGAWLDDAEDWVDKEDAK